ncbi:MAG: bifunctional 23S rRNA (guanine(2069)-N(7))-methyltransferase RlmK/23S rRNA (guanine(2445)-N(2))-methyltransferase RlmL [Gammaproteobacteria bacterium]|nr:bifunctional 23S rRNA (guanine(2069)-N(7))-methyltransferase RlmK/23S rRNA (guanine(2445)-N(2))-methyltransferase RlmL [Gammaproteobacteria bacterium]
MTQYECFITCPKSIEGLLADECAQLGITVSKTAVAGVAADMTLEEIYRVGLWTRLANGIRIILAQAKLDSPEALYEIAANIPWEEHLQTSTTFVVNFDGSNEHIRHTQFGAQRIKDAVVDRMRNQLGDRPSVDTQNPDIRIHARLHHEHLTLSLQLNGHSLHQRGYRLEAGIAPLKENLAAALLIRAGWPALMDHAPIVDPLCGSGTLLIEAALMAANIAPGVLRAPFELDAWRGHDPALWQLQVDAASAAQKPLQEIIAYGYDQDAKVLQQARANALRAGVAKHLHFEQQAVEHLKNPTQQILNEDDDKNKVQGLLITNPPYGERLSEEKGLRALYAQIGTSIKKGFQSWQAAIFTGNPDFGHALGLRSQKSYALFNGALPCKLLLFSVQAENFRDGIPRLSEGAQMFANRLQKNQKKLASWVKKNNIHAYRLYDADMPEYSVAVDIYANYVHVAEYAAPKTVDDEAAAKRFKEIQRALPVALNVPEERIFYKERRRQKGKEQYQKLNQRGETMIVQEGPAQYSINLTDYLDTGLFLDHRPVRRWIAENVQGQRFLNLFCYTGSVTVQAALAGASESVSVDLSNTYIEWAEHNFKLNGMDLRKHRVLRANCLEWIETAYGQYDVIFLDPPSFSNSKGMEGTLDIQRDHAEIIQHVMRLLSKGGVLIFSTNYRKFKLDAVLETRYHIKDVSRAMTDPDFLRDLHIHQVYQIKHAS